MALPSVVSQSAGASGANQTITCGAGLTYIWITTEAQPLLTTIGQSPKFINASDSGWTKVDIDNGAGGDPKYFSGNGMYMYLFKKVTTNGEQVQTSDSGVFQVYQQTTVSNYDTTTDLELLAVGTGTADANGVYTIPQITTTGSERLIVGMLNPRVDTTNTLPGTGQWVNANLSNLSALTGENTNAGGGGGLYGFYGGKSVPGATGSTLIDSSRSAFNNGPFNYVIFAVRPSRIIAVNQASGTNTAFPVVAAKATSFPTTPLIDDFNRANEVPIAAPWSGPINPSHVAAAEINTNKFFSGGTLGDVRSSYRTDINLTNVEAYVTVGTGGVLFNCSVWARITDPNTAGFDGYRIYVDAISYSKVELHKIVNGTQTVLDLENFASFTESPSQVGDSVGIKVEGTKIRGYFKKSGGNWFQILEADDASLSGPGYIGLSVGNGYLDDFSGGLPAKLVSVGQATETNSVFGFGKNKSRTLGLATIDNFAFAIGKNKTKPIRQASESSESESTHANKRKTIEINEEIDEAFSLSIIKTVHVGTAEETDEAQRFKIPIVISIGQATETDESQSVGKIDPIILIVAQATESDWAYPITAEKSMQIGMAEETNTAGSFNVVKVVSIGTAEEIDLSQSFGIIKLKEIGIAVEYDESHMLIRDIAYGYKIRRDKSGLESNHKNIPISNKIRTGKLKSKPSGSISTKKV